MNSKDVAMEASKILLNSSELCVRAVKDLDSGLIKDESELKQTLRIIFSMMNADILDVIKNYTAEGNEF